MPKLSELSISDRPPPALSGLRISFGKTLQYLACKTVTRRSWKDSRAKKFIKAFEQNKLIKALDKDIRYGGQQIGWCRLLCAPYKEQLAAMPQEDLQAEGGMCSSVAEFIKRYFKGNSNLEVWVIRFEFIELEQLAPTHTSAILGVYSDSEIKANSNPALTPLPASIHQASLTPLGVYAASESKTNNCYFITSHTNSIHQTQLSFFGVCADSGNKTDRYSAIASATKSIHQALLTPLGVYSVIQHKTNSYLPFSLSIDNIRQASPEPCKSFGVYSGSVNKTDKYFFIASATKSIHQASSTILGVYSNSISKTDRYSLIPSTTKSIHQASFTILGVYSAIQHQINSYLPLSLSIDNIHQASVEPRPSFSIHSNDSKPSYSNDSVHSTTESIEQPSDAASLEHQTTPDVYQNSGNEVDINNAISLRNDSIHQDCRSSFGVYSNSNNQTDTNLPPNPLAESIHQTQLVQGGSGLVYSFWKGESIVNHYRYKVKVNGKWKVNSVYIPVGKLPKVREGIASNLGVAAIVTEILGKKL